MFDITNPIARARWSRILTNKMVRLEPGMRADLRKLFSNQISEAARLVSHGTLRVDAHLDRDVSTLATILIKHYRRSGILFSEDVYRYLLKSKGESPREQKSMRDDFWKFFRQWSQEQAVAKAQGLNNVTKRLIARQIVRAQSEGMSYGETAKRIRERMPIISEMRSYRIARTEIHTASVFSTDKAVESTRLGFEREWVTVIDERTRISHAAANGQRRGMNEAFDVGGQRLMRPGDPNGNAGNTINCRCVLLYHRKRAIQRRHINDNRMQGKSTRGIHGSSVRGASRGYQGRWVH